MVSVSRFGHILPLLRSTRQRQIAIPISMQSTTHVYEFRPRKDKRGVDLISDALPFGRLSYGEPNAISNAIGYANFSSRSHHAVIRVYDDAGDVIETHEQGRFQGVVVHGCFTDCSEPCAVRPC
jgi:hypothetical protein